MVDRERHYRLGGWTTRARPVQMAEYCVFAERSLRTAVLQEMLQLSPRRVFRRAQQTRYGECPGSVGIPEAGLQRFVVQPAAEEAGHEGVAGAENVIDIHRKSVAPNAFFEANANRAVVHKATHRPALTDDCGV